MQKFGQEVKHRSKIESVSKEAASDAPIFHDDRKINYKKL